jgi:diguanylate cyclase (GGDEF)-like protein
VSKLDASLAGKRVLIVDDDPVIRTVAGQSLEAIGLVIEESEDGAQALASIDGSPPDLVLLDVEMPGLDGFATCAALRQKSASEKIPVMIATGHTDTATIEQAFEVGATDFITKPLDPQLLQHRARFVLHASAASAELRHRLAELRHSQERLATAQRMASIGSWEWIPDADEMLWSEEVYRILGIEPARRASSYDALLAQVHPDDRATLDKAMQRAALEGKSWDMEHRLIVDGGSERIVLHQAAVDADPLRGCEVVWGTIQDITERRRAEDEIRYLSYYDNVTGLPNRKMFDESLRHSLVRARRHGRILGLLFINLDRFKRVNETLGRIAGDELLKAVADRLQTCVRNTDHIGTRRRERSDNLSRLAGDEFTIVLTEMRSADDAALVAHRIQDALRTPVLIGGQEIVMSAAIGISLFPEDGGDVEGLLANANTAMHHAKAEGAGLYRFFNGSMNARALRNLQLEGALRRALERNALALHYQPLYSATSGEITSFEALVRWQSEDFGNVPPSEFIPLAEETGLIGPLGEWVLRQACEQNRAWRRAGLTPVPVAVNVSSLQFGEQGMVEMVRRALRDFELVPHDLELELTESALFGDDPAVIEAMRALKELGIRLALDDFGTGYSSLSYLVRFPIDKIKIDRSFVMNVGSDAQADAMIAAVVAMARRLGLSVTAEGVETAEQKAFLGAEGCDTLQGYLLGRPLDSAAVAALLRERAGSTAR